MGFNIRKHDDLLKRREALRYKGNFCKAIMFFAIIEYSIIGKQDLWLDLG